MKIKCKNGATLTISEENLKMGIVWSVSVTPLKTCAKNVPCGKECYADKMCKLRKNIATSYARNTCTLQSAENHAEIVKKLSALINAYEQPLFRWNVGGDFGINGYFDLACKVAENCPNTKFLAFTKFFGLASKKRPANFNLVLSAWNDFQPAEKQADLCGIAHYCDGSRPMPENAGVCIGKCEQCGKCFTLQPGQSVIFKKH